MKITKYGTIRGGNCDQAHNARFGREQGSKSFLFLMVEKKCFVLNKGWYRIIKIPSDNIMKLVNRRGGDFEIGMHRFKQDVVCQLYEKKKAFRWKWIELWAENIASFEFGFSSKNPLSIITPGEGVKFGYIKPWRDDIYKKKKQDNILKEREPKPWK